MSEIEKVIVKSASEDSASDTEKQRINIDGAIHEPPNQVPSSNTHTFLNQKSMKWVVETSLGNMLYKNFLSARELSLLLMGPYLRRQVVLWMLLQC